MRHPTSRTRSSAARWRVALVGILTAGLAMVGAVAGVAAPAAAKNAPLTFDVIVGCSTGDDGAGSLFIDPPDTGTYVWSVTGEGYSDGGSFDSSLVEVEVTFDGLATGLYHATVEAEGNGGHPDPHSFAEQDFTVEACVPDLDLEVTATSCSTGADGAATFRFTGLIEGDQYAYFVEGVGVSTFNLFTASGSSQEVVSDELPPGNYYVYVEWRPAVPSDPMFDWRGFAIEPCQPEITVEVTECTATGGTGSAVVTLSNLVAGVEYDIRVTDGGDAQGTPYGGAKTVTADADGTAQVSVSKLPPGQDFTVWVGGLWTTIPWEEPPFLGGGGNFTPIESVDLVAQADFTVKLCPVATTKPALAATGVDGVVPLVAGALVLLGLGGTALLITRRRRAGSHDAS